MFVLTVDFVPLILTDDYKYTLWRRRQGISTLLYPLCRCGQIMKCIVSTVSLWADYEMYCIHCVAVDRW